MNGDQRLTLAEVNERVARALRNNSIEEDDDQAVKVLSFDDRSEEDDRSRDSDESDCSADCEDSFESDGIADCELFPMDTASLSNFHATRLSMLAESAWEDAGHEEGVQIWRVCDGDVRVWTQKGTFHSDGTGAVSDEIGVAAGKAIELDALFDPEPTQSREVQGRESTQFRALFPRIVYLSNGFSAASTFTRGQSQILSSGRLSGNSTAMTSTLTANLYEARLFCVFKQRFGVVCAQVPCIPEHLSSRGCFAMDTKSAVYICWGSKADPMDKYHCNVMAQRLASERKDNVEATRVLDDGFWIPLGGEEAVREARSRRRSSRNPSVLENAARRSNSHKSADTGDQSLLSGRKSSFLRRQGLSYAKDLVEEYRAGTLYEISEESEEMELTEIASGDLLDENYLNPAYTLLLDVHSEVFVWMGRDSISTDIQFAYRCAWTFLKVEGRDLKTPLHVYRQGSPILNKEWNRIFPLTEDRL